MPKAALESHRQAKSEMEKGKKTKRLESIDVVLPNAIKGKVVVRFGTYALLVLSAARY